jgi:hypothetical protein
LLGPKLHIRSMTAKAKKGERLARYLPLLPKAIWFKTAARARLYGPSAERNVMFHGDLALSSAG